ncbi:MAG TPA: hypothetical protein VNZ57_01100 [Longimicrobiales bacterium]|nr:hypothetical protein [Longimicrobiales bacterium]
MDVFALRDSLIDEYSSFARSFTTIRARDLREPVAAAYESGRFWPDPLIQINPPDILLTNFMMLERLMTRQDELDRADVMGPDYPSETFRVLKNNEVP